LLPFAKLSHCFYYGVRTLPRWMSRVRSSSPAPIFFFLISAFFGLLDKAAVRLFVRLLFDDALVRVRHGRRRLNGLSGLAHKALLSDPWAIAGQVVTFFLVID
jgi:hypothetical protein